MKNTTTRIWVGAALLAATTLGLMIAAMRAATQHRCEVCITYLGRSQCREAAGRTPEEATRTATDNACAFLAAGMTAIVECQHTAPDSVRCDVK